MMGELQLSKSFHNIARDDRAACALARVGTLPTLQTLSVPLHNLSFMEEEVLIRQMSLLADAFEGEGAALPSLSPSFIPSVSYLYFGVDVFLHREVSCLSAPNIPTRSQPNQVICNDAIQRAL